MSAIQLPTEAEVNALRAAFAKVCDPKDWKREIRATVPAADLALTVRAIKFMTATDTAVSHVENDIFLVYSIGYRRGPAGDH